MVDQQIDLIPGTDIVQFGTKTYGFVVERYEWSSELELNNFTVSIRVGCSRGTTGNCYLFHADGLIEQWREFADAFGNCGYETIESFEIKGFQLTSSVLGMLEPALATKRIKTLSFGHNQLGSEGYLLLASYLEKRSHLEKLEVVGNALDDEDAATRFAASIKKHQTLRVIKLEDCGLGVISARLFATLFSSFKNLTVVDLRSNDIGSTGVNVICDYIILYQHMKANVEQLILRNNEINDGDAVQFAKALGTNNTLRKLNLQGTDITAVGEETFMKAVFDATSMETVLSSNHTCRVETRKNQETAIYISNTLDILQLINKHSNAEKNKNPKIAEFERRERERDLGQMKKRSVAKVGATSTIPNATNASANAVPRMGHPEMDVEQNLPPLPSMFPRHVSYANWRNKGHSRTYAKAIVQFQKNMQEVVEALSLPSDLACRKTPLPFLTRNGEAGGPLEITFHISSDSRSGQCYLLHDEGLCPQWKLFADALGRFGDGFGEPSVILKFDHIQMTMSVMMDILWVAFESKVVESLTLKSNELGPDEIGSLASFIERAYVKKLQINGSNIDNAESASHLSRAIAKNGNISVFNVEDCGIGRNSGVLSAIANVMKCVSKVFLSRNDIGSDGAKIIADMLADNMMVMELYLNNNELEDEDMRLFANALRTNTNLRKLYLNKCDGSGLGKRALAKALFDRTSLVTAFNSNHYCRVFIDDGHCIE
jgi:Ran GTPase-activating protein (RanGAP) involved in mRNA processing and transport